MDVGMSQFDGGAVILAAAWPASHSVISPPTSTAICSKPFADFQMAPAARPPSVKIL